MKTNNSFAEVLEAQVEGVVSLQYLKEFPMHGRTIVKILWIIQSEKLWSAKIKSLMCR